MSGDYSEKALGRQQHFQMGSASTSYLLARGNLQAVASIHDLRSGQARELGLQKESKEHYKNMVLASRASSRLGKRYKPGTRLESFYGNLGNRASMGHEKRN